MENSTWLARERFFAIAESRPRIKRIWQHFIFDIDANAIYTDIPTPYVEDPDDESFAGPVRRWYGAIHERLFVVDLHFDSFPQECMLQIPYSDAHDFAWQALLDLQRLPAAIRTTQPIYITNDAASRVLSVFRRDDRGFDYPIYDGISTDDAESLLHFLQMHNKTITYSLGESEPDINWVAKEIVGASEVHRARYNSRTSALSVGCDMSNRSTNKFIVYSESPEIDNRHYTISGGTVINVW